MKNRFCYLVMSFCLFFNAYSSYSKELLADENRFVFDGLPFSSNEFLQNGLERSQVIQEELLVKIISEPEGGAIHNFLVDVSEEGRIISLIRRSKGSIQVISGEALTSEEVVLARSGEKKALMLSCGGCTVETGGRLKLKYLYNGVSMDYRSLSLQLESSRYGQWELLTNSGEKVYTLKLISRKIFGRLVGIKEIRINP